MHEGTRNNTVLVQGQRAYLRWPHWHEDVDAWPKCEACKEFALRAAEAVAEAVLRGPVCATLEPCSGWQGRWVLVLAPEGSVRAWGYAEPALIVAQLGPPWRCYAFIARRDAFVHWTYLAEKIGPNATEAAPLSQLLTLLLQRLGEALQQRQNGV